MRIIIRRSVWMVSAAILALSVAVCVRSFVAPEQFQFNRWRPVVSVGMPVSGPNTGKGFSEQDLLISSYYGLLWIQYEQPDAMIWNPVRGNERLITHHTSFGGFTPGLMWSGTFLGFLYKPLPITFKPKDGYILLIPYWPVILLASIMPTMELLRRRRRLRELSGKCQRCGYDLRASTDRCPECGEQKRGGSCSVSTFGITVEA
jgi:hypothetical protein